MVRVNPLLLLLEVLIFKIPNAFACRHLETMLLDAGVRVLTSTIVSSVHHGADGVTIARVNPRISFVCVGVRFRVRVNPVLLLLRMSNFNPNHSALQASRNDAL